MRETPAIFMRMGADGLLKPVSQFDNELLNAFPLGVDLEVTIKHRKRSLPQLRAYWAGLHELVRATECYPTAEHLHEAIKFKLGYTKPIELIGEQRVVFVPDSAAFQKMDGTQFKAFLDRAQKLCLEQWGFNIMEKAEAA